MTQAPNDVAIHPDALYVDACLEMLGVPEWQPSRALWKDLCDVALGLIAEVEWVHSMSALAAGTQGAETRSKARAEGCQSGGFSRNAQQSEPREQEG